MSGAAIIKGDTSAVKQPDERNYSDDGGVVLTERWLGASAAISDQYASLLAAGTYSTIEHNDGPLAEVTATSLPDGEQVGDSALFQVRWQIDTNLIQLPLRTHPYFLPTENGPYLDRADQAVRDGEPFSSITGSPPDLVEEYFYALMSGVKTRPYTTFVVRHIQTVGSYDVLSASGDNVNTVVDLPTDLPLGIQNILPGPDEYGQNIEWLLQPPRLVRTSRTKYELTQEYWGGTPLWGKWLGGTWNPAAGR